MRCFFCLITFFISVVASGQDSTEILRLSIQDIASIQQDEANKISLASKKEQFLEEAPSVVSVITRNEIQKYGCQDIADVLRLVPGFEFGIDVNQIVGLGFRGIWAHEGKALIMLNGLMLNDLGYGNYNFIGTIPASMIERVEIIRGPGSALYGGFAGVTVINIITVSGNQLKGIELQSSAGIIGKDGFLRQGQIAIGTEHKDLNISFLLGISYRPLAQNLYRDFFGNELKLNEKTSYRHFYYSTLKADYKNIYFQWNRTNFNFSGLDGHTTLVNISPDSANTEQLNYQMNNFLLGYKRELSEKYGIDINVELNRGNNIATSVLPGSKIIYEQYGTIGGQILSRYKTEIIGNFKASSRTELWVGTGYFRDIASITNTNLTPGLRSRNYAEDSLLVFTQYAESFYNLAQGIIKINRFNLTFGGRYEITTYGNALAPRIGISYFDKKLNLKALYGKAFRIPTVFQAYSSEVNTIELLHPETSSTYEIEVGYKFTKNISARINSYWIDIQQAITYIGNLNAYTNEGRVKTRGIEAELLLKSKSWTGFVNAALNFPSNLSSEFLLNQEKTAFIGMASQKINSGIAYTYQKVTFSPSVWWLSSRFGQSYQYYADMQNYENELLNNPNAEPPTTPKDQLFPSTTVVNFNILFKDIIQNSALNITCYNIFNTRYEIIQPFYGGHANIAVFNRQFSLSFQYRF
ncbi:MAG: TonB-dependent receptor plug domain-containing protein [Cytophagales bacterium]|nr:TonB-dependent receptor plug domain-containing protein [Cytophagales bacterium]MDW8384689.1 TonB-dependent receptor plug domain-containing protein [Flammeovirgaceae bacterium]